ncbi:hypothetical protein KR222_007478 [Zaprionus bogoriensis]|nr:hypothetical protein KR222_007478 [Zaprionus bogoriensis]
MASKRLSLMLEECGEELEEEEQQLLLLHDAADDLQQQRSAKRCRLSAQCKRSALESPLQRLLQRQSSSSNSNCGLSPITELAQNMRQNTLLEVGGTPKSSTLRSYNSVSSSYDSGNSLDDEYMAMFELESLEQLPPDKLPDDLDALLSGQLKSELRAELQLEASSGVHAVQRSVRRCLSMTQQQQESLDTTPLRGSAKPAPAKPPAGEAHMRKAASMNNMEILNALADEPELIGDLSRPCALPVLLQGVRHRDLKTISCDTLARLMRGEFAGLAGRYTIVDCRYPYEYEGGHIRHALNLYTRQQIVEAFPASVQRNEEEKKAKEEEREPERSIYVFHCEFSSERGPKLLRFLRSNDRSLHTEDYPTLDYPELYLLHNGYKEFYAGHSELCEPRGYVPMLAPAHNEAYRLFRAKTKSWQSSEGDGDAVDSGIGGSTADCAGSNSSTYSSASRTRTLYKSRSRLLYAE